MKQVVFHKDAESEFRAAVDYYDEQRSELGSELAQEVKRTVNLIARMPGTFTPHGTEGLRKCMLRRFPYTLFYLELEQSIWIAAVAHQRRRPDYWKQRLLDLG